MKRSHFRFLYMVLLPILVGIIITAFALQSDKDSLHSKPQRSKSEVNQLTGYTPKEGFVPNKTTAIKVAKAIIVPIYGKQVLQEAPFNVRLIDSSFWVITGTLPKGMKGGVVYIKIRKSNCEIINVQHGK